MTIKLDNRIETAFKKGFFRKREDVIEYINPKKKRISIVISNDGFDIERFDVNDGYGCSFYYLGDYGKRWALTEEELL